jgi:hypothetical protein
MPRFVDAAFTGKSVSRGDSPIAGRRSRLTRSRVTVPVLGERLRRLPRVEASYGRLGARFVSLGATPGDVPRRHLGREARERDGLEQHVQHGQRRADHAGGHDRGRRGSSPGRCRVQAGQRVTGYRFGQLLGQHADTWGSVTFHPWAMYVALSVLSVANRSGRVLHVRLGVFTQEPCAHWRASLRAISGPCSRIIPFQ